MMVSRGVVIDWASTHTAERKLPTRVGPMVELRGIGPGAATIVDVVCTLYGVDVVGSNITDNALLPDATSFIVFVSVT